MDYCAPKWSPDGKYLFVPVEYASRTGPGRTLAIPLGPDETLPLFPEEGIPPAGRSRVWCQGPALYRGAYWYRGEDPDHYAWINATVQRNLYRISLP